MFIDKNQIGKGTENRPWPIDIDALLEKLESFRRDFAVPMKDGTGSTMPDERKRFTDCVLAMLNARSRTRDGGTPDFCYFEDTKDLLRYLHQIQRDPSAPTQLAQLRALAPRIRTTPNQANHTIGYKVRGDKGKNAVVAFEPATEDIGYAAFQELAIHSKIFPGAIHNAAMLVLNVQKSQVGCPTHDITVLRQSAKKPGKLNELFESLSTDEKKKFKLIKDSFANILHFSVYGNAASLGHLQGVVDNPNWYGITDVATASIDDKERSLLARNQAHRITREVVDLETEDSQIMTFSNAVDHDRVMFLDWLIHDIKKLQMEHPEEAGQILADELAGVWRSRQPGWDRDLSKLHEFIKPWDTTNNRVWEQDHPCWQLPFNDRMEVMAEMLNAIPRWHSSPTLRINLLARIVEETKRISREELPKTIQDSKLLDVLEKVPEAIQRLAPIMWESEELDHWCELNRQFMHLSPTVDRLDRTKRMAEAMEGVGNGSLKDTSIEQLIKFSEDARIANSYNAEYGRILLRTLPELLKSSNQEEQLQRYLSLSKAINNIANYETKKQLKALVELAINFNEEALQSLLEKKADETKSVFSEDIGAISLNDPVATIQQYHGQPQWLTFDSMQEKALMKSLQDSISGTQEDQITIDKENEDTKHPLQRLNGMRDEWHRSQKYLPKETEGYWKNAQADLVSLTKEWKQKVIESKSDAKLNSSELLYLEEQWSKHERLNQDRIRDIVNETMIRIEGHKQYLQGISQKLTDIDATWRYSDRDNEPLMLGEIHQAIGEVKRLDHEIEEAKVKLNEGNNTGLKEVRKITNLMAQQQTNASRLLQEVQDLGEKLLSVPKPLTPANTPPMDSWDDFGLSPPIRNNEVFFSSPFESVFEQPASKELQIPDLRPSERIVDTESKHLAEKLGVPEAALQLRVPSTHWDWGPFVGKVVHVKNEYIYLHVVTENDKPVIAKIDGDFARGFQNASEGEHFRVTGMPSRIKGEFIELQPPSHKPAHPTEESQKPPLDFAFAPLMPPPASKRKTRRQAPPNNQQIEIQQNPISPLTTKEESALQAWVESFKGPYHAPSINPTDEKVLSEWMEVLILEDDVAKQGQTSIDQHDNNDVLHSAAETRVKTWIQRVNELMPPNVQSNLNADNASNSAWPKIWIATVQNQINDILKGQLSSDVLGAIDAGSEGKTLELKKASHKDALGGSNVFFKTDDVALIKLNGGGERARIRIVTKAQGGNELQVGKTVPHNFTLMTRDKAIDNAIKAGIDTSTGPRR